VSKSICSEIHEPCSYACFDQTHYFRGIRIHFRYNRNNRKVNELLQLNIPHKIDTGTPFYNLKYHAHIYKHQYYIRMCMQENIYRNEKHMFML